MNKYVSAILLAIFLPLGGLFAQSYTKMNGDLYRVMHDETALRSEINILVKGNIETIHALTTEAGGTFKYSAGNIASVLIPVRALHTFLAENKIERMESYKRHMI